MNSFHLVLKRSQTIVSPRFFSKGAIPTTSAVEVGGIKVIGLPHLSVRWRRCRIFWVWVVETLSDHHIHCFLLLPNENRRHPWGGPRGNHTGWVIRQPTLSLPSWVRQVCFALDLVSTSLRLHPMSKSAPWRGMCASLASIVKIYSVLPATHVCTNLYRNKTIRDWK